ncbi:MAG: (d)CMP kinase [Rhizobiales bacterium]|nr:(d)CMP kinase [Hyphomicrobiales bacterium]
MIIAVDGPAAAGKGTLARALAAHYGYHFLDTGSLYRMVALAVLSLGQDPRDPQAATRAAETLDPRSWTAEALRDESVGQAASIVAAFPPVRTALLALQRNFAAQKPGAVLDGRDIGTVVCPEAEAKIFVTASPEVRARRRSAELAERGETVAYEDVLADIHERDARDRTRSFAPLVPAGDAHVLDTTDLDISAAVAAAIRFVDSRVAKHSA